MVDPTPSTVTLPSWVAIVGALATPILAILWSINEYVKAKTKKLTDAATETKLSTIHDVQRKILGLKPTTSISSEPKLTDPWPVLNEAIPSSPPWAAHALLPHPVNKTKSGTFVFLDGKKIS